MNTKTIEARAFSAAVLMTRKDLTAQEVGEKLERLQDIMTPEEREIFMATVSRELIKQRGNVN